MPRRWIDNRYEDYEPETIQDPRPYEEIVSGLIRERYTIDAELAILRQRDTKPEEFEAYNTYTEECKARAKEIKGNT